MWGYYDCDAMSVKDILWFETEEEAKRFVKLATQRQMEEYPDEPETWGMFHEELGGTGIIFKISPPTTAEKAVTEWFDGEW